MQTMVDIAMADGIYECRLGLGGMYEIEKKCGPIGEVIARVMKGRYVGEGGATFGVPLDGGYKVDDLIETIRQGLIGGGKGMVNGMPVLVPQHRANEIINNYFIGQPLITAWGVAAHILLALAEGYDPPEKKNGDGMTATTPPTP